MTKPGSKIDAGDHAALRHVATLVATGSPESTVFAAVNEEIARIVSADATTLSRFEQDDQVTLLAAWNARGETLPVGERRRQGAELRRVRDSGLPVRFDVTTRPPFFEQAHELALRSAVFVPIKVDGRVWGVVVAGSEHEDPLPVGTEPRMAAFTELVSAALSNAQAREDLQQLAAEQAALRRIADLAAGGASPGDVLGAVVGEATELLGMSAASLMRYEPDGAAVLVAVHGAPPEIPLGTRVSGAGDGVLQRVFATGQAVRLEGPEYYDGLSGDEIAIVRAVGITGSVGAPVFVEGELWGAMTTAAFGEPLPAGLGQRMTSFASLVGTAIGGALARRELRDLADEQAALRRVAEFVARSVGQDELLATVAAEASRLIDEDTTLLRIEEGGGATVVAASGSAVTVGEPAGDVAQALVTAILATGRLARHEEDGREYTAGVPIVVEHAVWGVLSATKRDAPLALAAEQRLRQFGELIGAAVANAQARATLERVATEQAALRRVAEFVAHDEAPERVLDVVVREASDLLDGLGVALMRYKADGEGVMIAVCRSQAPLGLRVPPVPGMATDEILRTGNARRVDQFADTPLAEIAEEIGVASGVGVPIFVEGRVWGMLSVGSTEGSLPDDAEGRLSEFAVLVGAAIANAEHRAQLTASRARVVAAADESRRRLQRDVHDGAQQRLVQTVVTLKLAEQMLLEAGSPAAALVTEGLLHAERANAELRNIVRGILPASLTRGGLRAGVESLVSDVPLPVAVEVLVDRLLPDVETTAFFVVAEGLTNVVKHARATRATVRIWTVDHALQVEVSDDGAGGVDAARGSGLTGLFDRVEARTGTLTIISSEAGTTIRAWLPLR